MSKVITDRAPPNHVAASVIKLLNRVAGGAGTTWGYIPTAGGKGVRAIVCVGGVAPVRIFIHIEGAKRRKLPKMGPGDVEIEITRPETHQSLTHWESTTAAALMTALSSTLGNAGGASVTTSIRSIADPKYLAAAAESAAMWAYFNRGNAELSPEVSVYYDDCLKYPLH